MVILELVGLSKYFGSLQAVDNIDLAIEEGEMRGLIGPNGSGKTTLFNLVTGFLQPTAGKILWQGKDITRLPSEAITKKGIGRTFQLTTLFKEMTALENVIVAYHLRMEAGLFQQFLGTPREREKGRVTKEKALDLLESMGIAEIKDEIAGGLPHGHQRALGIAIALATEPKLLLLDEPVTGMNPTETADMMKTIKGLRDRGLTLLIVEHDMKAVMGTCERITVMNFGKKIAEGTPKEVSKHKEVIEAYLGRGHAYA